MSNDQFFAGPSLANFLKHQAEWRRAQGAKFPNDVRNPRSAAALDALAEALLRLPDNDRRLHRLNELGAFTDDGRFHTGTATHRYITRIGFDLDAPTHPEFLDRLIDAVAKDRSDASTGAWSAGSGSWRWQYPPGYTATHGGQLFDVVEAIAEVDVPPAFVSMTDGTVQIAPRGLSTNNVRFRLRPIEWASAGGERWIGLDELDDGPHLTRAQAAQAPDRKNFWPPSPLDGTDTYRRGHGPLEVGVVEKFELPKRDTHKRRIVGDYIAITGTEYRDVIVALEPHPIDTLRHVRTVRMHAPTVGDPRKATGAAVGAYIRRCAERNLPQSGWTNEVVPNYWAGMDIATLKLRAESGGPSAAAAAEALVRQNYWRSHTGEWIEQFPSVRSTGIAVGGTTITRVGPQPRQQPK